MNCIQREALGNWLLTCGQAIKQWQNAEQNQNTVEIILVWQEEERMAIRATEAHWQKCTICNQGMLEEE